MTRTLRRAAIVAPVRTPVAKFLGALASTPVETLAGVVVKEVVKRTGVDPALIDDVVFAQSYASGETPCIGRWAALAAGLPIEVPGMQLDRRCGGGLTAITTAAMMVESGAAERHFGLRSQQCNLAVLRGERWKYVHFGGGLPPLLYDMQDDPGELRNLADDPHFLSMRMEMAEKMLAWRAEHLDQSLALCALTPDGVAGRPAVLQVK